MRFIGGLLQGASEAPRLSLPGYDDYDGGALSKEWSGAPRARLCSEDFAAQQRSSELAVRFLFEEESLAKPLWSAPTADEDKFSALLLNDCPATGESQLLEPPTAAGETGSLFAAGDCRPSPSKRGGEAESFLAESPCASSHCFPTRNAREDPGERLRAKIRKVRCFWRKINLHIPDVFRRRRAADETFLLEQQDLSHKALLIPHGNRRGQ